MSQSDIDYILSSKDELTRSVISFGVSTWNELTEYVKNLPYGRNKNRTDLGLVLSEMKGTCSSKHALLKHLADLNAVPNIKLILGIYKMNQVNTPKIGCEMENGGFEYIPEAHCYLKTNDLRKDFTSGHSDIGMIENDIIYELEIEPSQVSEFKVSYHREFIQTWLLEKNLKFEFDEIWQIREQCIKNLTA